jgi:hypothetical protein
MYKVIEKSCKICAKFLQEILKKSRNNVGINLVRFLPRSCKILQIFQDLARLCNFCKILARILARFLSRGAQLGYG